MPYYADLRCSYFKGEMNISWVYEVLKDDFNLEWEFDLKNETEYEELVDTWFKEYTAAKVFGFDPRDEYRNMESIWEMYYIKTIKYLEALRKEQEGNVKMIKMPVCPTCCEELDAVDYEVHYDSQMRIGCHICIDKCCGDLSEQDPCAWSERNWKNEGNCKCVSEDK